VAAVPDIPRRRGAIDRRAGELRLVRYSRTRDRAERDELVRSFMPLARSAAARYQHTSESFDDLLQVALLGLLKAIDRFDPARGTAFSSFAVPTMLGELRRHLRDHSWSIHVPRELQELGQKVTKAGDELARQRGRPPTVPEVAAHLHVTVEAVVDARQAIAAHSPASLDERVGNDEDSVPLGDLLGSADAGMSGVEDALLLEPYLARLPARDRRILQLRFGQDLKQREIGALLGISQMHVSRLIRQSLERLRAIAETEHAGAA